MSERLVDKSELQGQGHGRGFAQKVRAALGGRPEAFGGAHLVSECGGADLERAAALRALKVGQRALRRLLKLRLARSMTAWRARTVNDHRAMAILAKVALRWRAGAVSRSYRRWALTARRFTARKVAMVSVGEGADAVRRAAPAPMGSVLFWSRGAHYV